MSREMILHGLWEALNRASAPEQEGGRRTEGGPVEPEGTRPLLQVWMYYQGSGGGGAHGLQREAFGGCLQEERPLTVHARSQWNHLPPLSVTPFHAPWQPPCGHAVSRRACAPLPRREGSLPPEGGGAGVLPIALCPGPWAPPPAHWASGSHPFYSQDTFTLLNIV